MNKLGGIALWMLLLSPAVADSMHELQQRLSRVNQFSAEFVQTVTDPQGEVLQQSQGKLWLQRPTRFCWETRAPEESIVISDGKTLWFYTPQVQQVTATRLSSALENSPLLLISRNQPADWQRYQIQQQGDHFTLTPRQPDGTLRLFTVLVTSYGVIQQFSVVDQTGQQSQFVLQKLQRRPIPQQRFTVKLPPGVALDDQR